MGKTLKSNKFVLILLFALAILLSVFSLYIINSEHIVKAEEQTKAYRYEILSQNDGFKLLGYYTTNDYYVLGSDYDYVSDLITLIEQDRVQGSNLNKVSINFINLDIYESLVLNQGEYELTGKIGFTNISNNACISVINTASVVATNLQILTATKPSLILASGSNTSLRLDQCTISSEYDCVVVENGSTADITNSQITSNNGIALTINGSNTQLNNCNIETSSAEGSAIKVSQTCDILINSTTVSATNFTYAIENNGARLYLYGSTKVNSKSNAIKTNEYICTTYSSQSLNSCSLNIFYSGTLSSQDTLLVKDFDSANEINCNLINSGYQLRFNDNSLWIAKLYRVTYNANCSDNIEMPTDENSYYNLSTFNVQYLETDVRPNYNFIGYAFNKNATEPDLTNEATSSINGANVTLYAVWEAINYTITILGVNDGECSNANSYNYSQSVEIQNPTRQFYTFAYWIINGTDQEENLTLPYKDYTNITIEAVFEVTDFNIVYNNLTENQVRDLDLITSYNIFTPSLNLAEQNYLLKGYSFYGLLDANNQDATNAVVNFGIGQTNTIAFTLGEDLVINVDAKPFYNGNGNGSKTNAFVIDSSEQFYNLISGVKDQSSTTYLKLNSDLVLDSSLSLTNIDLTNFVIDGNKKTLTINALNKFNDSWYSVFPNLCSCTFKNLTINGEVQVECTTSSNIAVCVFANSINDCSFSEVINNILVKADYSSTNAYSKTQVSGFVGESKNSVINNCAFNGKVQCYAQNPNKSVYLCGFATSLSSTLILNSNYGGEISYNQDDNNNGGGTIVYACGFAVVNSGNTIANCLNIGSFNITQKPNNQAVYAGIAVAIRANNEVINCASVGEYLFKGQTVTASSEKTVATLVWAISVGNQIENCVAQNNYNAVYEEYSISDRCPVVLLDEMQVAREEYNYVCNQTLSSVNNAASRYVARVNNSQQLFGLAANNWGDIEEQNAQYKIVVKIHNNINNEVKVYVFNIDSAKKIVVCDMFEGYLFDNFYYDSAYSTIASVKNINDNMEIYAKYITFGEYTLKQSILPIALVVVDILLIIAFIIFCERPRKVIFVVDGKEYDGALVKWGKQIELTKDKTNYIWYTDSGAEKAVRNLKMPFVFGKYKLYAYSDKQGDAIEAMHKAQQDYISKAKANKKQAEKVQKTAKARKKSKVQQEIESSGITIVKKQVNIPNKQNIK